MAYTRNRLRKPSPTKQIAENVFAHSYGDQQRISHTLIKLVSLHRSCATELLDSHADACTLGGKDILVEEPGCTTIAFRMCRTEPLLSRLIETRSAKLRCSMMVMHFGVLCETTFLKVEIRTPTKTVVCSVTAA